MDVLAPEGSDRARDRLVVDREPAALQEAERPERGAYVRPLPRRAERAVLALTVENLDHRRPPDRLGPQPTQPWSARRRMREIPGHQVAHRGVRDGLEPADQLGPFAGR
jgi:hypothetical protein